MCRNVRPVEMDPALHGGRQLISDAAAEQRVDDQVGSRVVVQLSNVDTGLERPVTGTGSHGGLWVGERRAPTCARFCTNWISAQLKLLQNVQNRGTVRKSPSANSSRDGLLAY